MPLYEFKCNNEECDVKVFEIVCSMSQRMEPKACEKCGESSSSRNFLTGGVCYDSEAARGEALGGIRE